MRQFTISLLLAAVACLLGSPTVGAADNGRRVQVAGIAFYNFENLFDTIPNNAEGRDEEFTPAGQRQWDGRKYRQKIHNLAYAISQFKTPTTPYGPALLGVSEIENRSVMEDVINQPELRDLNLRIVHHDSPDARGVDVGLIYNPRYFRVHNVTNHRLNAVPFRTRDQMCVVGSLLGQQIAVIVNHWPSRIGGQEQSEPNRVAAAELCMQIADSLWRVNPQMGVIIMGDLNDDPGNKSCAQVLGAKKKISQVKPGGFFNPFWQKLDEGIGSYIYRGGWDLFDQIIVGYNLLPDGKSRLVYDGALVINNLPFLFQSDGQYKGYPFRTFSGGVWTNGYSDHLPTEIFLTFK